MTSQAEKDALLASIAKAASAAGSQLSNLGLAKKRAEALVVDVEPPADPPPPPPVDPPPPPPPIDPPPPPPPPPPPLSTGYGADPSTTFAPSPNLSLTSGREVTNLRITAPDGLYAVKVALDTGRAVIRNCVIDAGATVAQAVGYTGYELLNCTINGGMDGAKANGNTRILGCDFTPRPTPEGAHADGIQITGGTGVEIGNTRIVMGPGSTSCILIKADIEPIEDVWLHDLFLDMEQDANPNYALYPGGGVKGCKNVRVERVVFADRLKWAGNKASGLALYPSMRPSSGYLRDCRFADGTPIPDETWG